MSSINRSLLARLLTTGLAVVAILAGGWWWLARDRQPAMKLPTAEQTRLTTTVVPVLEAGLPDAAAGGARLACVVKLLGIEPADAATADAVTTAYVWSLCERLGVSTSGAETPAVVHLGASPTVEAPRIGNYGHDVDALFPKRLQKAALDDTYGESMQAALQKRVQQLS